MPVPPGDVYPMIGCFSLLEVRSILAFWDQLRLKWLIVVVLIPQTADLPDNPAYDSRSSKICNL